MAVTFRIRRDTAATWISVNPILALGEPAIETDTRKVKYGDGSSAWTSLPYSVSIDPTRLSIASNLSDLASVSAARTNLGLGTLATQSGTFSGTSSGTNTGDQTSVTGNSGTATKLLTARTISLTGDVTWSVSFDGSANATAAAVLVAASSAPTYSTDAAAGTGGLTSGKIYKTSDGSGGFFLKIKA